MIPVRFPESEFDMLVFSEKATLFHTRTLAMGTKEFKLTDANIVAGWRGDILVKWLVNPKPSFKNA